MTKIIVDGLDSPSGFSIFTFYLARARRILPPLIFLCIALLIAGWFVLCALDYRLLGKYIAFALLFFSNIGFQRGAGYFDTTSHENFLLHTWSLSAEWQFYILLPLALLLIWKLFAKRRSLTFLLLSGFILSLGFSIFISPTNPNKAFYLLHARAWEMLAGSIIYALGSRLALSNRQRTFLNLFGFINIVAAILLFNDQITWPSWHALLPVMGAMFILLANKQNSFLTNNVVFQWVGRSSYSLYLWHWPVVVALSYMDMKNSHMAISLGIICSLLLGGLAYHLVEVPSLRFLNTIRPKYRWLALIFSTLLLVLISFYIKKKDGLPTRQPQHITDITTQPTYPKIPTRNCHTSGKIKVGCAYGGEELGAIVIGDSHSRALIPMIQAALPSKNMHILRYDSPVCPTIQSIKRRNKPDYQCSIFIKHALKNAPRNTPLFIINRSSLYIWGHNEVMPRYSPEWYINESHTSRSPAFLASMRKGMIKTACEFAKKRPVYMLRPIPEMIKNVPQTMGRAAVFGNVKHVSISLEEYHKRHAFVWEAQDAAREQCGVKILNPLPYLCHNGRCYGDENDLPLYRDDDHLNKRGADKLRPLFEAARQQKSTIKINE